MREKIKEEKKMDCKKKLAKRNNIKRRREEEEITNKVTMDETPTAGWKIVCWMNFCRKEKGCCRKKKSILERKRSKSERKVAAGWKRRYRMNSALLDEKQYCWMKTGWLFWEKQNWEQKLKFLQTLNLHNFLNKTSILIKFFPNLTYFLSSTQWA